MKKMSLKLKLTFLIAAIVLTVVGVICLLNSIFFEKYYIKDREKKLVNSYNEMKEVLVSDGISSDSVRKKPRGDRRKTFPFSFLPAGP